MKRLSLLPRKLVRAASPLVAAFLIFTITPRPTRAQQEEQPQGGQQTGQRRGVAAAKPYGPLAYRPIGPYRGGRVDTVAGVPSQPMVYYFGAAGGGGVWKTTDGGVNWEPLGDQTFKTGSVGAIAVSESDPNVVYVGMGEETLRGNVSHGDGMYKSTDAGKTWKKIGLDETRHIGRIRVHPRNPDLVYVAAIGHCFGPNEQRGVFRSKDGGKTWEKVLFRTAQAGADDLILDPTNPSIIYASFWQYIRKPWTFESGGPDSNVQGLRMYCQKEA